MERERFRTAMETGEEAPDTQEMLRIRNWYSLPREQQLEVCEREKKSNLFYWLDHYDYKDLRKKDTRGRNQRKYFKNS